MSFFELSLIIETIGFKRELEERGKSERKKKRKNVEFVKL